MRKSIQLLLLALATGLSAYWVMETPPAPSSTPGEGRFLPGLAAQLDLIQQIRVEKGSDHWTLTKTGGPWQLTEKDGYPADLAKVREILLGMTQWERLEPKTQKAENYPRLGLAESGAGTEEARRVEITGSAGTLASIRIGKRQPAKAGGGLSEFYVKTAQDPQVWLVQGRLADLDGLRAFLNTSLVRIDRERVREVRWRLADGDPLRIFRSDAKAQDFQFEGLTADEKLKSSYGTNGVAERLAGLMLEDVRPVAAFNDATPMLNADLATFEGLSVHLDLFERDGKHWARLKALVGEAVPPTPVAPPAGEVAKESPKDAPKPSAKPVGEEVAELNRQWDGWAFALPEWQIDGLKKRRDDLVEKNQPSAAVETIPVPAETRPAPAIEEEGLLPAAPLEP